jgi:hypothetical protein
VYLNLALQLELRRPAQRLAQDFRLITKLGRIIDVLVLAASTAAKVRAAGVDALR